MHVCVHRSQLKSSIRSRRPSAGRHRSEILHVTFNPHGDRGPNRNNKWKRRERDKNAREDKRRKKNIKGTGRSNKITISAVESCESIGPLVKRTISTAKSSQANRMSHVVAQEASL